jgi:hypothetical protein
MVRAILAGTKSQTRRVISPQPDEDDGVIACGAYYPVVVRRGVEEPGPETFGAWGDDRSWPCPYGRPGDRLWLREAWRAEERASDCVDGVRFRSDDAFVPIADTREAAEAWGAAYDNGRHKQRWRPSIFLPRWASRLTLEVTSVRVERVQSISEEDARAEGVDSLAATGLAFAPREVFRDLWDSINGERPGCAWEANPWCWVVSFKRAEAT